MAISSTISSSLGLASDTLRDKPSARAKSGASDTPAGKAASTNPFVTITLSRSAMALSILQPNAAGSNATLAQGLTEEQAEGLKTSNDLVGTLKQARSNMVADRKAAAEAKLDQARKKLEMLKLYGGDPRSVARQAKAIAEEIKSAAKEYAGALKSEGGPSATAQPAAPSTAAAEPPAEGADAATQGAAPAAEAAADSAAKPDKDKVQTPEEAEEARQTLGQGYREKAAEIDAAANKARGEREMVQKFKDAGREARQIIERAVRQLKDKNAADPDANAAEKAKAGMEQEIQDLEDTVAARESQSSDTLSAPAPIDAGTMVINILA
ncbi:hypothetical protein E8L99_09875 [Phreatobacter aquaticus]|uniref:Uncharacterized protein n=1 Tax=Phreatobacter aquaticus TaxID=2570229 RepID=A0A4D7QK02_9HYPH|nr:hypothetical protein [Phreatobacter aquaticus]QCK86039.1 hypothetical protein E8L99_09875 [Phreatobacter aquaticus]